MKSETFKKARAFPCRDVGQLDLTRFQYHFENGSKEQMLGLHHIIEMKMADADMQLKQIAGIPIPLPCIQSEQKI